MGLSIAISGGIIICTIIYLLMSFPTLIDSTQDMALASGNIADVQDAIDHTNINITSIEAPISPDLLNFTLANDGVSKLWDYGKFNVIVTYDSGSGSPSRVTEQLNYQNNCPPTTGGWCTGPVTNDYQDPGILNNGESMTIESKLSNTIYPTGKMIRVVISTDSGVVATRTEVFS